MGVLATMTINNRVSAAASNVASGLVTFPAQGIISIFTLVPIGDAHRYGEIYETIREVINYARDKNFFAVNTDLAIATNLSGRNNTMRTELLAASLIDGDIGILIDVADVASGSTLIIEDAYQELLEWMLDKNRLST